MKMVKHTNIVKLYEVLASRTKIFIVRAAPGAALAHVAARRRHARAGRRCRCLTSLCRCWS
jgi:hypothetical protein